MPWHHSSPSQASQFWYITPMTLYLLFVNSFTSNLAPSRRQKNSQTNPGWPADLMRSESINQSAVNQPGVQASSCIMLHHLFLPRAFGCFLLWFGGVSAVVHVHAPYFHRFKHQPSGFDAVNNDLWSVFEPDLFSCLWATVGVGEWDISQRTATFYQWPWQIDFAIFCYHPLSCIFVHHRRSFASFCKTKSFCEHHYRAAFGLWDTNTEWGSCLALGPRTCRSPSVQWLWCCKGGCLKWLQAPRIRSNQSLSRPNSSRRKAANGSPYSAWSCSPYVFNAEDTLWVAHPFCSCMLLCATAVDVCMRGRRRG